jgi:hypothetical protein
MTAMPPEPDRSPQTSVAPPPAWPEPMYPPPPPPSARDLAGPPRGRGMNGLRIATAVMWAAITVICAAGAVAELLVGIYGGAVVCLIVAVGSGWYDYRVWKRRARRLLL